MHWQGQVDYVCVVAETASVGSGTDVTMDNRGGLVHVESGCNHYFLHHGNSK
jgi:hypothetical protein